MAARTVAIPSAGLTEPFELADFAQWRLLEGLDDVALTLRHEAAIAAFESGRAAWLPHAGGERGRPRCLNVRYGGVARTTDWRVLQHQPWQ